MSFVLNSAFLTELNYNTNFSYILNDDNLFALTQYKVLQNQEKASLVKCMMVHYNGKIQLYYVTKGFESLLDIQSSIEESSFLIIVKNFLYNILMVKENEFFSCQQIVISPNRIYVNTKNNEVQLTYLPLKQCLYNDFDTFEKEVKQFLFNLFSKRQFTFKNIGELLKKLIDVTTTIEDLYNSLPEEILKENKRKLDLVLSAIGTANAFVNSEIKITKEEFVLGRNPDKVDTAVMDGTISRVHCKITEHSEGYLITDLQSANGTFVNNIRLASNVPCLLKDGDCIHLGNVGFQVMMT